MKEMQFEEKREEFLVFYRIDLHIFLQIYEVFSLRNKHNSYVDCRCYLNEF